NGSGDGSFAARAAVLPPSNSIDEQPQHQQVKEIEGPDQRRIGLQELPHESLGSIDANHGVESMLLRPSPASAQGGQIDGQESSHRQGLVNLHRVAANSIAKVDGPGKLGRYSISVIGKT